MEQFRILQDRVSSLEIENSELKEKVETLESARLHFAGSPPNYEHRPPATSASYKQSAILTTASPNASCSS